MKWRFLLPCGIILACLGSPAPLPAAPAPHAVARPKMIILPARVTWDGIARPDLGQSISDIISARLLTSNGVELLDADQPVEDPLPPPAPNDSLFPTGAPTALPGSPAPAGPAQQNPPPANLNSTAVLPTNFAPAPRVAQVPVLAQAPAPAPAPVTTGLAMGADLVVQPTIVGQADEFRLTLRQVQIPGGRIMAVITEKTNRGLKGLYALAENHALRLVPYVKPGPRIGGGPAIVDHPAHYVIPTPPAPVVTDAEIAQALPALAKVSPAKQAAIDATLRLLDPASKADGPSTVGRIGGLDGAWSFCTITLRQPLELPPGTALFATAGGNPENLVNLSVTRTEGRTLIADITSGPAASTLRAGDLVYYWKP